MKLKSLLLNLLIALTYVGSLFGALAFEGPSIVFVHIGKTLPSYLETAIRQARLFNSGNIILVANAEALQSLPSMLEAYHTVAIPCESLQKTKEHLAFIQNSRLDKTYRNGFWNNATERFFYLQDLMEQYQLRDVVHLENDNMLYVDLSILMPIFHTRYLHIGMTLDNDNRCIPGFVYVADASSITHLVQFVATKVSAGLSDMQSLALYHRQFGSSYASHLPIIMNAYVRMNELISPCHFVVKDKFLFCLHQEAFSSIFDAAALGQYLGGIDPIHLGGGKPGFINESCVFNPSLLTFSWQLDAKGRAIPFAKYLGSECRINNLHIHSKNLQAFRSDRILEVTQ